MRYEKRRLRKERQRNEKTVQCAVKIQCNSQAKEKASEMHISSPIVGQTQRRFGQVEEGIRKVLNHRQLLLLTPITIHISEKA